MHRPALLLLALGLAACSSTPTPAPALSLLEVRAVSPTVAAVRLSAAPERGGWTVSPSELCGAVSGPPVASGAWPAPALLLEVPARAGDLVMVWAELDGHRMTAADCPL